MSGHISYVLIICLIYTEGKFSFKMSITECYILYSYRLIKNVLVYLFTVMRDEPSSLLPEEGKFKLLLLIK